MPRKTQKSIREMGKLYHADPEINQDDLPVFFKMSVSKRFSVVVDMEKKDEIGIICPGNVYKVINQNMAELILEIALERKESLEEYEEALRKLKRPEHPPTLPLVEKLTYPWGDRVSSPYKDIMYSSGPYIIEDQKEISPDTTTAK